MPKLFFSLTRPVSRLAAASHRLRKAQLGAAFGQRVQGQIALFGVNCGAKGRTAAMAYRLLLNKWIRSVHAEIEVSWVALDGWPSGQELDGNVQNTAYRPHPLKTADVASEPLS